MTSDEKRLIAGCRVMIIGESDFIDRVNPELQCLGFRSIHIIPPQEMKTDISEMDMVAEYTGDTGSCIEAQAMVPMIYPFDFVEGAGAIVTMPGDDNDLHRKKDMRLWAAEYMAGYCAFWNVEGYNWLQSAIPAIREGKTSEAAMKTAAHICARIAANIAVGRKVKHFPKFYLCETDKM